MGDRLTKVTLVDISESSLDKARVFLRSRLPQAEIVTVVDDVTGGAAAKFTAVLSEIVTSSDSLSEVEVADYH